MCIYEQCKSDVLEPTSDSSRWGHAVAVVVTADMDSAALFIGTLPYRCVRCRVVLPEWRSYTYYRRDVLPVCSSRSCRRAQESASIEFNDLRENVANVRSSGSERYDFRGWKNERIVSPRRQTNKQCRNRERK